METFLPLKVHTRIMEGGDTDLKTQVTIRIWGMETVVGLPLLPITHP